ncbi:MAG: RNA methyltransferase [Muribaculaceae bacterium]|nr:RNA methyltransferase [Muribaculaceae bacterium]
MSAEILSKAKLKELKSLSSKKERDSRGLFLAEGHKCVVDMLEHFRLFNLICTPAWIEAHPSEAEKYYDRILTTDKRGMEIISSLNSLPDVIAVFCKPEGLTQIPKVDDKKLYLLLDEIQDPGNLGTIIRTCDWFGIYQIFASTTTVDAFNAKVVQASMGSLSRVSVEYLDLEALIDKNPEIKVIGTLLDGVSLKEVKNIDAGFLLMGNEGKGISEALKRRINVPVTIMPSNPFQHPDSLNVAIATAIALYHLRQV